MNSRSFDNISLRGRTAFAIMCFERYIMKFYPDRDWTRVVDLMWKICDDSDYIDLSFYRYSDIIPRHLYEPEYYDNEFNELTEEDYKYYITIIPRNDEKLDALMFAIYEIPFVHCYGAIPKYAPFTWEYIDESIKILNDAQIPLPDIKPLEKYLFSESSGWGHTFDGGYLSIISQKKLNQLQKE